jgi:tetratricopeptide (TPR) repeat protein
VFGDGLSRRPSSPTLAGAMRILFAILLTLATARDAAAEDMAAGLADLRHAWAKVYYQVPEDQQVAQFAALRDRADALAAQHPEAAEPLILKAIILSTYAEAKGSLDALGLVEAARDAALKAAEIDDKAVDAGAYTVLGVLYYKVPGWPIGFGSNRKAREYLDRARAIAPDAIDVNYFTGDFLLEEGDRDDRKNAKAFLEKALQARPRPGREDEDAGRKRDIAHDLGRIGN